MYEIKYRSREELQKVSVNWIKYIPIDWSIIKLKLKTELNMGQSPDSNYVNQEQIGIPFFQGKAEFGDENPVPINYCTKPSKIANENDILISVRAPVGEINIVNQRCCIGRGLAAINNKFNELIKYQLISSKDALQSISNGTTFKAISVQDLANLEITNIDKYEQQKIANFLDIKTAQFDQIISKKEQLIEKLEEAKKSLISEVVTGKVKIVDGQLVERDTSEMKDSGVEWLGMIPMRWEKSVLKYHCYTIKGFAFKSDLFKNEGIPVVKTTDIKNGTIVANETFIDKEYYSTYKKVKLVEGDIVMSTVGSHPKIVNSAVGQIAKVPQNFNGALLNQNALILRTDENEVIRDYIYLVMASWNYRKYLDLNAHGTANQSSLSLKEILGFPISYPCIEEQKIAVSFVENNIEKNNALIEKCKKQINMLKEAKQSLISEAVTGKIDLRDWEIIEEGELQ